MAALTCLLDACGLGNPLHGDRLHKLSSGLVKSATLIPMVKTPIMPIAPFYSLFDSWGDNATLPIKDLRLKAICLLALIFMLRPSDIAPQARSMDPVTLATEKLVFSLDQVHFSESGLTIVFHGIKNDAQRDGFSVTVPRASNRKLDPVSALDVYIQRTEGPRASVPHRPVFLSLQRPYHALSASSISGILKAAIDLAGLGKRGYTAKSFRPTAATAAIDSGLHPDKARHIGRWASHEVFEKHYVHTHIPDNHVDKILS